MKHNHVKIKDCLKNRCFKINCNLRGRSLYERQEFFPAHLATMFEEACENLNMLFLDVSYNNTFCKHSNINLIEKQTKKCKQPQPITHSPNTKIQQGLKQQNALTEVFIRNRLQTIALFKMFIF